MPAPSFSAANFVSAMQALLPRGKVWPRDQDATQTQTLTAYAPTFKRQADAANELLVDAFPATTVQLLPEWEETLGLPDPCAGPNQPQSSRQAHVLAKFIGSSGQSAQAYIDYASKLGFSISVTSYATFRVGQSHMGSPLASADWIYAWSVNAPVSANNGVLECELMQLAPAHTALLFKYS